MARLSRVFSHVSVLLQNIAFAPASWYSGAFLVQDLEDFRSAGRMDRYSTLAYEIMA